MNWDAIAAIAEVIGVITIVASLVYVAAQIRQNNKLATAEAIREIYGSWEQISLSEYGTDIADLYIKSIERPEDLSSAEIIKLSAWLTAITAAYGRQCYMYDFGLAEDPSAELANSAQFFFGSSFSRSWYEENKSWMPSQLIEIIDREIRENSAETKSQYTERIKSRMKIQR